MAALESDLYIDGAWVAPVLGGRLPVVCPTDGQVYHTVAAGSKQDIDKAVAAARRAFDEGEWPKMSGAQRAGYLRKIAAKVTANKEELARMESRDCGKALPESLWDMDDVAGCFEYYAELAEELDTKQDQPIKASLPTFTTKIRYEPVGVAGLITPWNYPLLMAAWKVAPALAAGCTIVLKPSEITPVTALRLTSFCHEVGLPRGVVNVVTGYGPETGGPLSAHPGIDKVAFTGSGPTGLRVANAAAPNMTRVGLELGGKSAFICFDDVDIDAAVEWAMFGCFWTNGQICSATSRLLIQENIAEKLLARLVEETRKIPIGDPLADGTKLGPVVSQGQFDKVMGYINGAIREGATLLTGGQRPVAFPRGYFIEPTILRVNERHTIWREEVFGPVLSVMTFRTEAEAIHLANNSEFGLGGAVMSKDKARCDRVAKAFRAGIVWVNCSQPCFTNAPWGGFKKSGSGRELGPWGLNNYLEVKQVTEYITDKPWGWYLPSKL